MGRKGPDQTPRGASQPNLHRAPRTCLGGGESHAGYPVAEIHPAVLQPITPVEGINFSSTNLNPLHRGVGDGRHKSFSCYRRQVRRAGGADHTLQKSLRQISRRILDAESAVLIAAGIGQGGQSRRIAGGNQLYRQVPIHEVPASQHLVGYPVLTAAQRGRSSEARAPANRHGKI